MLLYKKSEATSVMKQIILLLLIGLAVLAVYAVISWQLGTGPLNSYFERAFSFCWLRQQC